MNEEPIATDATDTTCPWCRAAMTDGHLAVNGKSLFWAEVLWEPRVRRAAPRISILKPGIVGQRTRPSWVCQSCGGVLVPPNGPPTRPTE